MAREGFAVNSMIGLPAAFWDGIIGAVVGGLLTGLAGFLATWYAEWRSTQRETRMRIAERDAAIQVVRYELGANATKLDMYVRHAQYPGRLTDAGFTSVQLLLARELPDTLSAGLVWAYEQLAIAENNIAVMRPLPPTKRPRDLLDVVSVTSKDLDAARNALAAFAADRYDADWLKAAVSR